MTEQPPSPSVEKGATAIPPVADVVTPSQPEFTTEQLERILGAAVGNTDFQAIKACLTLLAVQAPDRAEYWRDVLLLGVAMGQARHAAGGAS